MNQKYFRQPAFCPMTGESCREDCEWRMFQPPYDCCIPQIAQALKEIQEKIK